jgi:hypothetical protein
VDLMCCPIIVDLIKCVVYHWGPNGWFNYWRPNVWSNYCGPNVWSNYCLPNV